MNVIITGGRGFVGSWLQQEFSQAWPQARVESWDLPQVDITKPETYESKLTALLPDWIVHLAAIASVPAANKNPQLVEQVNVGGTEQLLSAVQRLKLPTKVLFTSTADIYGKAVHTAAGKPLLELPLAEARPSNPYAQSKYKAEQLIEEQFKDFVLRVRPFPHIGPGQGVGFVTADFASQIAAIEKGNQAAVLKVGNLSAERDFTDVRDVVRAYRLLMEQGKTGEVYHVASGVGTSIQNILDQLLSEASVDISVEEDKEKMRAADTPVLVGNAQKLRDLTGWQPEITLQQSLQEILDWWRAR
ncbi:MAG: GDP-mannose 4,6-dehydratase [Candidatus Andersenbacteria bacterium]|nr:GDP-mannose 4,6-dehydratase [Candidatus Andersenbacteria bacterium]MBI3251138.1 GDP-mannose 4,6-dehydratase [Candidatus Andersenbacteria bacterium]